jgi:nicotinate-nucleotide adenylyltransferase
MSTRIGILGGTFDPIHRGHLAAAAAARRALRLDRVLFVPSSIPPHRPTPPLASEFHRFAMVALAISGRASYEASDIELQMGGLSYTSRTLEYFASLGHPPSSLFFITGADAFADIDTWHAYPQLLERAHFVVVSRQGRERSARRTLPVLARYMREAARLDPEKLGSSPLPAMRCPRPSPVTSNGITCTRCRVSASSRAEGEPGRSRAKRNTWHSALGTWHLERGT